MVKGGVAKDLGSFASSSGTKRKNKPIKKRCDALKKKNIISLVEGITPVYGGTIPPTMVLNSCVTRRNEINRICKKFILVNDNNPMTFMPLGIQFNTPHSEEPANVVANVYKSTLILFSLVLLIN